MEKEFQMGRRKQRSYEARFTKETAVRRMLIVFSMITSPTSEDAFAIARASMLSSPHGLSISFLKMLYWGEHHEVEPRARPSAGGVVSLARHLLGRGPGRSGTARRAAAARTTSGELEVG